MYTSSIFDSLPSGIFVGREEELERLERLIIRDNEKVITISGNNSTGKTLLWRQFLNIQKDNFGERVQVLRASSPFRNFPTIDEKTKLVIIDDISYDFYRSLEKIITDLINRNSDKQFLLVGAHVDRFKRLSTNNIHLNNFEVNNSDALLNKLLKSKISPKEIQKIANEKAKEKLSTTELTVSEIAFDLGFEHSQSFSKLFKVKTNLSPLEFRSSFN